MNRVLLAFLLFAQGLVIPGTQAGTVQGRILNLDASPAANLASPGGVRISMIGGDRPEPEYLAAVTSRDGIFDIPRVPPGTYTLRAIATMPELTVVATTISVSGGQVLRGIEISFPAQKH